MKDNHFHHTIINTPVIPFYEFMPNFNTLCIKACMGLGKTNTLYDFIKYNMDKSILIISFRVSLEEKYSHDLPSFTFYQDTKGLIESSMYDKLIIQIDSLWKVRGQYDIIIFDEFTYIINHLITFCKKRELVYEAMKQIMELNSKMIFLDAFLDKEIVNWISTFSSRNVHFIENKYSIHNEKKIISYKHDINNFIKEIKKCLTNKEKIVIASNNKSELEFIELIINRRFPKIRKSFITKETKKKYNIKEWDNIDVLAYTPTITAGISYTKKRFDKVFGLFCNSSSSADMSIQQLFRVRNISTNEYHICCKITGKKDYPINDKDIEKFIINNEKCLVDGVQGIKLNFIKNEIKKDEYFYLYKYIQKKIFKSNNSYMDYMLELLKDQGITNISYNCTFNKEETKIYNKELKLHREEKRDMLCETTVNMPLITDEEAREYKYKHDKTTEEFLTYKKHDFLNITKISNELLTKDIYKTYEKNLSKLYHISYMYTFYEEIYERFNKRLNIYEKNNINKSTLNRLHNNKKLEKRIYANDIIISLGFDGLFDKKQIELNKENVVKYIKNNHKNIENLFKTKLYNWEDIIEKDNKYFLRIMRYLNDRIYGIFNVRIVMDKKSNKYYIKGLDYWNEIITYKNPKIIEHIKEKEQNFYDKDELYDLVVNMFCKDDNLENDNLEKITNNNNNNKCFNCNNEAMKINDIYLEFCENCI